jgi:hypothetical protein
MNKSSEGTGKKGAGGMVSTVAPRPRINPPPPRIPVGGKGNILYKICMDFLKKKGVL